MVKGAILHTHADLKWVDAKQGTVVVDGTDLAILGEATLARWRRARIGLVFQFLNLLDSLAVAENVPLPAQLADVRPRAAAQSVQELPLWWHDNKPTGRTW